MSGRFLNGRTMMRAEDDVVLCVASANDRLGVLHLRGDFEGELAVASASGNLLIIRKLEPDPGGPPERPIIDLSGNAELFAVRDHAFLRLWCAKEAVLKAHGHGVSFGLHRLRFGEEGHGYQHGNLRLVECDPELGEPAQWQLRELQPAPGYLGALAWRPRPASSAASPART